jgi:hypothetical protein
VDTSGNAVDLTQSNGAVQMLYSNSTITQNGLPVVIANAGTEFMQSTDTPAARVSYSIYLAVSYQTSDPQFMDLLRANSSVPTIDIHGNVWTSFPPSPNGRVGYGSFNAVAAYPAAVDGAQILSFHLDHLAGTGAIYRANTLLAGGLAYTVGVGQNDGSWTIGWSASEHGYQGLYFEIAIYRGLRPHNATERAAKVAALAAKWGI